jgi:hypothetical protein
MVFWLIWEEANEDLASVENEVTSEPLRYSLALFVLEAAESTAKTKWFQVESSLNNLDVVKIVVPEAANEKASPLVK